MFPVATPLADLDVAELEGLAGKAMMVALTRMGIRLDERRKQDFARVRERTRDLVSEVNGEGMARGVRRALARVAGDVGRNR